ncbi:MAG: cytochrome c biogenesis protein ResB [Burkholderiales bacterium]
MYGFTVQNLKSSFFKTGYELLSSMRFAISLLTVLSIASVIGTVLKQGEPYANYVFQFGEFWFGVFDTLGLYDVYHTGWFLAILAFLVFSTALCLYRNVPMMLREFRSYREHAAESSLRHFAHRAEWRSTLGFEATEQRLSGYLAAAGYRSKSVESEGGRLLAAKTGSFRRLGYIFTHAAIVVICIGGLLDGNLPLKFGQMLGKIHIETADLPASQYPPASRLGAGNMSFRGNVLIPEGSAADFVFINVGEGMMLQELPFSIHLNKFHIDFYPTGQPKLFVSDVTITDKDTGRTFEHSIAVNHPLIHRGVAIYQASFNDGGSKLKMSGWNLFASDAKPFPFNGAVNQDARLSDGANAYTVEFSDFRLFNVENLGGGESDSGGFSALLKRTMNSTPGKTDKNLHNVGPNVRFTLRNSQGQASEYENYMQPVPIDGRRFYLSGVRGSPSGPFRYLRFPADENDSIEGFMQLRAMLFDAKSYPEIARRFAARALQGDAVSETLRNKFLESTEKVLQLFARGGYEALAGFIEKAVPKAEQNKAAETYLKVLESAAFEANRLARERAGNKIPVSDDDAKALQFVRDSLNAVSDSFFYGGPVYLQLTGFEQIQASGFQLTRSPGHNIVYLGSGLLILGVFLMFYVRERRIWLLVKRDSGEVLFAMASNRKTLDFEQEFEQHTRRLAELLEEAV